MYDLHDHLNNFFKKTESFEGIGEKLQESIHSFFNKDISRYMIFNIHGTRHLGIDYHFGKKVRLYPTKEEKIFIYYNLDGNWFVINFQLPSMYPIID